MIEHFTDVPWDFKDDKELKMISIQRNDMDNGKVVFKTANVYKDFLYNCDEDIKSCKCGSFLQTKNGNTGYVTGGVQYNKNTGEYEPKTSLDSECSTGPVIQGRTWTWKGWKYYPKNFVLKPSGSNTTGAYVGDVMCIEKDSTITCKKCNSNYQCGGNYCV